jgi:hypothetical protein
MAAVSTAREPIHPIEEPPAARRLGRATGEESES